MSFLKANSAVRTNAPSPTPSNTSAGSSKRKRPADGAPPVVYSQPMDTGTGEHVFTRLTYVNDYLRERKDKWHSFDEIMGYLNIPPGHVQREQLRVLMRTANDANRISWDSANEKYRYRPKLNVLGPEGLKAYLQSQKSSLGLSIKDLKDGWATVADDIAKMEDKREVLVQRNKDGVAKTVWMNDPSLMLPMDAGFAKNWHMVRVPNTAEELRKALLSANMKAATKAKVIVPGTGQKKRKAIRRNGKQTNTHMAGILRDFSGMRK
ncbi:general transcription factor spTFIIE beta subunit [Clathrospora elynae]|uniref:Transcription initiation factor IIE subunit beta n=1 Tax=Clathrospora elynae TaxID=706981 RepID=A0A6A5SHW5_9PLEO|nr:general transcription factor spTFIIE beta subunit [Clathrospora elynae]